jgi:hypothetical protein
MSLKPQTLMRESPILNSICQNYYAKLSNLTLVARSSQKAIGTALEVGFTADSPKGTLRDRVEISSYLMLSLCFKEYCHSTNLAVRLFGTAEFETISCYYNRLAKEHIDRQLLMFSGHEVQPILERVGDCIRSMVFSSEG